jgi:hypothetical protein
LVLQVLRFATHNENLGDSREVHAAWVLLNI